MGDYTGFRFKVIVKPEYRQYIKQVLEAMTWLPNDTLPMEEWLQVYRRNFIPWGSLCYMPTEWKTEEEELGNSTYNEETGEWRVICSLKDYDETDIFIENILSNIIESYEYIQTFYEYWDEPMNHEVKL